MGRFFYRWRNVIAIPFFLLLLILGNPEHQVVLPHLFVFLGIGIRLWSAGYIGEKSRGKEIKAEYRIINGPYRISRHPLYVGNFFLVLGTILLYNPALWFGLLLIVCFVLEYSVIVFAEEQHLKNFPAKQVKFHCSNLKGEISTIIVLIVIYLISFAKVMLWQFPIRDQVWQRSADGAGTYEDQDRSKSLHFSERLESVNFGS
ncbi:MAG: methyltransferase [candidate division WOR-3 bacterium]